VADLHAARAREAQMLAPPRRLEARDESAELFQIICVDALGAADGEIQPMRDDGEMRAQQIEFLQLLRRGFEDSRGPSRGRTPRP